MLSRLLNKYNILRGMISYAVLWPAGCLVEQVLVEKKKFPNYDWNRCLRYSIFGSLFNAPHLYGWLRFVNIAWPNNDFKSKLAKVFVEEISLDPYLIVCFFYGMAIMEGESHNNAVNEVKNKFFMTLLCSCIYWPTVQLINFTYVSTGYQVITVSVCSFFWTVILALLKSSNKEMKIFTN